MSFSFVNLNDAVRTYMVEEFDLDVSKDAYYKSPRLLEEATESWPDRLRNALRSGSPESLADDIRFNRLLKTQETRNRNNRVSWVSVPRDAPEVLAEGEYNRYYIRGLCRYAIENNIGELEVYRAKPVARARTESEAKIGMRVNPSALVEDLRSSSDNLDTALGVPSGPNSGLSVRIPD